MIFAKNIIVSDLVHTKGALRGERQDCIHMSNLHVSHLKYTQCLSVNHTSAKLRKYFSMIFDLETILRCRGGLTLTWYHIWFNNMTLGVLLEYSKVTRGSKFLQVYLEIANNTCSGNILIFFSVFSSKINASIDNICLCLCFFSREIHSCLWKLREGPKSCPSSHRCCFPKTAVPSHSRPVSLPHFGMLAQPCDLF